MFVLSSTIGCLVSQWLVCHIRKFYSDVACFHFAVVLINVGAYFGECFSFYFLNPTVLKPGAHQAEQWALASVLLARVLLAS